MPTTSPIWTLVYGGVEKSFAAWGLHSLTRRQSSQSDYQVTFSAQSVPFDGTAQFAFESTIVIKRNGVRWWTGPVVSIPKIGSSQLERIDYVVASPWYWLQNLGYQQEWAIFTGSAYVKEFSSHLFIGQAIQWLNPSTGLTWDIPVPIPAKTNAVIKDILDYAIDECGVSLAYDADDLLDANASMAISIPVDECREISCAEAIRRVTKWLRDIVIWWDFTPATPVLRFSRKSAAVGSSSFMPTATMVIGSAPLESVELTPRHDLQPAAVCLNYEQTEEVDGSVFLRLTRRFAPTVLDPVTDAVAYAAAAAIASRQVGAMVCTIDLKGLQAVNVYGAIEAAAIDPTSRAWWERRYPWMTDANIDDITITVVGTGRMLSAVTYPNEIVSGAVADWMPIDYANDVIEAKAVVKYKNDGTNVDQDSTKKLSAKIWVTDSPAGTTNYSTTASFEAGDEIPANLHTDLFNSLTGAVPAATLQYSGQIVLRESECGNWLATAGTGGAAITPQMGIGLLVNITGGTGAFATIKAMVQGCDEDIDSGTTTLTVGPPEQLDVQSLVSLLMVTRTRQIYNNPRTRGQGMSAGSGQVNYPGAVASESASTHTTGYKKLTIATPIDTPTVQPALVLSQGTHKCELNVTDLINTAPATPVKIDAKFRKIKYCKGNTQYNIWVLCSALYDSTSGNLYGEP